VVVVDVVVVAVVVLSVWVLPACGGACGAASRGNGATVPVARTVLARYWDMVPGSAICGALSR
jgi:hypothetical protein